VDLQLLFVFVFGIVFVDYFKTKIAGNAIARIRKAKEKALAEIQQGKETNE